MAAFIWLPGIGQRLFGVTRAAPGPTWKERRAKTGQGCDRPRGEGSGTDRKTESKPLAIASFLSVFDS